jgi:uncharacterized membrane protein
LIWGGAFLVLGLCLDVLNGVFWFKIKSNCLTGESLDEDLHTTAEAEYKGEGGLVLDVLI